MQRVDLCFEQRNALYPLGEFARVGEVLSEGRALAEGLDDQRRLGRVLVYQAHLQSELGEHARAIEAGKRARAIAEAVGDLGLQVVANYYFGQALWLAGDLLRELWSLGQGPSVDELIRDVTGSRLEMASVAARIREGLAAA